jgi:hypothetical protein
MAFISFVTNGRWNTLQLESNTRVRLIIPFSQTLPIMRRIPPIDEKPASTLREVRKKLGRIIDILAGWSMAELQDFWKNGETGRITQTIGRGSHSNKKASPNKGEAFHGRQ